MPSRIGVDIGGTKIDALTLSSTGATLFEKRIATPNDYATLITAVSGLVAEAAAMAGSRATVGIGAPGSASPKTGLWRNANMVFCNGKPLPADLAKAIHLPVKLENDANCFALSEAHDGAGAGYKVVAFYTLGTALGGGLVIDGKLRSGPNAEAAEFGHLPLPWPNETEWPLLPCFCGKSGCVEQYVSGTGLARDYNAKTGRDLKGAEIVARRGGSQGRVGAIGGPVCAIDGKHRQYPRSRHIRGGRRALVLARAGRGIGSAGERLYVFRIGHGQGRSCNPW
jgi:fructokinase